MSCVTNRTRLESDEPPPISLWQQQQASDEQKRHRCRPRPQPACADEQVEHAKQRRCLCVLALLEIAFEVKADGREAHEAEHQCGAQAAFKPIERVGLEPLGDFGKPCKGECGHGRCAARQHLFRREVRLFDHLGKDLGEDAGVGNGDGEHAGDGTQADTCIRSSAQNSSWIERSTMADTRTAAKCGKAMAERKPAVAAMPTPTTANATVQTTLHASIERRSGPNIPRARRSISAHGLSAVMAMSATAETRAR